MTQKLMKKSLSMITVTIILIFSQGCSKAGFNSKGESSESSQELDKYEDTALQALDSVLAQNPDVTDDNGEELPQNPYNQRCHFAERMVSMMGAQLAPGSHIVDARGNLIFRATDLGHIENATGNIIIVGDGTGNIDYLKKVRGNVILCNLDVGSIEDAMGNMIIVNGNVGDVTNTRGNLIVANGDVGFISNSTGNIIVRNGDIAGLENTRGNVILIGGQLGSISGATGNIIHR